MTSPDTVRLEDLTWPEVERAIEDGRRTVIVAVGAIEQHGPHLPLGTDTLVGDELAASIAETLGDGVAAPTIRPGCSPEHLDFPGTISLSPETVMNTIRDYGRSLDGHGFETIVLLPTHGGNFAPVNTVAPEVARELNATVLALANLGEYMDLTNAGLREADISPTQPVIHAGAGETALALAINDDLVRCDEFETGYEGDVSQVDVHNEGFESISATGVLGDPSPATADAGRTIIETVTESYVERIEAQR